MPLEPECGMTLLFSVSWVVCFNVALLLSLKAKLGDFAAAAKSRN